jgi:hypothetical protein
MRLSAQQLSVRKRRAFQRTRSNFTLSPTDSASGKRTNATRDGAYSKLCVQPMGLQPPPGPTSFFSILIVNPEPLCPRSKPSSRSWTPAVSIASGKPLSTVSRVARERDLPTGANNERRVLGTALLTKSCAKGNPACLRQGTVILKPWNSGFPNR